MTLSFTWFARTGTSSGCTHHTSRRTAEAHPNEEKSAAARASSEATNVGKLIGV